MMRLMLVPLLALTLLACHGEESEQIGSSALMGSALGIPGGPIGIVVGGAAGAAVGALLPQGAFDTSKSENTRE